MSVEIHDPKISKQDLLAKAAKNMATRTELVPSTHGAALSEQRMALRAAIEELRTKTEHYGTLDPQGTDTRNRVALIIKQLVKKAIQRHLDQQREVNESLLKVLDQLTQYLEQLNQSVLDPISDLLAEADKHDP